MRVVVKLTPGGTDVQMMKRKIPLEFDLIARGVMIALPVAFLKVGLVSLFGKYLNDAIPILNLGFLLGISMFGMGFAIIAFKILRLWYRRRQGRL